MSHKPRDWDRAPRLPPPPPLPSTSRIPPEALAAVERVLAHRADAVAEVAGQERWRSTTVEHQCRKAESHARYAILESGPLGDPLDDETGEHHAAHAAARALLACALYYQRKDKP